MAEMAETISLLPAREMKNTSCHPECFGATLSGVEGKPKCIEGYRKTEIQNL